MGEYGREQRKQGSRVVSNSRARSKQLKEIVDNRYQFTSQLKLKESMSTQKAIQLAQVSNIVCPRIGNNMALGNMIHGMIEASYLRYGFAGDGNTRRVEQPVLTGHNVDLALHDGAMVSRFGEIKANNADGIRDGQNQINTVVNDQTNTLENADQLNLVAWADGLNLALNTIGDPTLHLVGAAHTGAEALQVEQDLNYNGLYLYSGH